MALAGVHSYASYTLDESVPSCRAPTIGRYGRVRLGFICDSLEDNFQAALVDAALAAAGAHDVDLIVVPGGKLGESYGKNFIHELVPLWVDGLIVAAHTIGHNATELQMAQFLDNLRPIPTVTLGEVSGADCCLSIDNEAAAYSLTQHLLTQHHHERFAYLAGPDGNAEAYAREHGFRRALQEAGLTLQDELRMTGDFTWEGGRKAFSDLLDRRGVPLRDIQAVVCANDAMAVGVCLELERRDYCIPKDVAVVGFDDTDIASHLPAPLTTVRQPLHELLFDAVQMLRQGITTGTHPVGSFRYSAEPIHRRSCGCPRLPALPRPSTPAPSSAGQRLASLNRLEPAIRAEIDESFAAELDRLKPGWLCQLLDRLGAQMTDRGSRFHDALEVLCFSLLRARRPATGWHNALLALRRHVARSGLNDDKLADLDHIVESALRLTSEMTTSFMARQREELLEHLRVLSDATAGLLAAPDLSTIANVARASFPKLGVQRGVICLFSPDSHAKSEISPISSFGLASELSASAFSKTSLGSDALLRGRNWVVEPLGAGVRPLGFAILQTGLAHVSWYERLRNALTAAVNGAQLVQQVQRLVVTDPLTGLSNRRHLAERIRCEIDALPARLPLSLFVLDLDGFKALNDLRGHDEGDRALVEAGDSIRRGLRETDTLARFGGDEFVAVLPGTTAQQATAIAQRILVRLPPDLLEKVSTPLTCSIGVATLGQLDSTSGAELFRLADQALLTAKRDGKNRVVHASTLTDACLSQPA